MAKSSSSNKKVANSLVALSSAAVLTVYAAGFVRTKAAAERYEAQSSDRRSRQAPAPRPEVVEASLNTPPPMPVSPAPAPEAKAEPKIEAKLETPVPAPKPAESAAPAPAPAPVTTPAPAPAAAVVAPAAPAAPAASSAPLSPPGPWKDGTWKGWGNCRHGDLQAAVVVEAGKIVSATVSDCQTRYSCDIIDKLYPQVVKRQSADVDRVGGATESSDAFYYAVYEALRQAHDAAKGAPPVVAPQAN